ncbi:MAG: ABC transporter ATP-binding protein [Candidatus Paceibacterota bacterium]|jgi:lipopolysaccharide transport system ATP-binding protein
MDKPIIEVKNIGKKYNITHMKGGYIALRDVIASALRNPFSFIKNKAKQAVGLTKKEEFWALKDVSFTVKRGEIVGVIGANGAGKSTLLKVLSQITPPTEGEVMLHGRVGSLLEVGTGFHPELTGRENIFLNGAILGMKKGEIASKFDQIVEFAGIEKFLDTPVKYYSSGMYVRLAFSVAAHMEPDILLIDEVLAVGDAEFQKKCLGKMNEITKNEGRTILFVSHNLEAIRNLCPTTILLEGGKINFKGSTNEVIKKYNSVTKDNFDFSKNFNRRGNGLIKLTGFDIVDENNKSVELINTGMKISFNFFYRCENPDSISNVDVGFSICKQDGMLLGTRYSSYTGEKLNVKTEGCFKYSIDNLPLDPGTYGINARILANGSESDWPKEPIKYLTLTSKENERTYPDSIVCISGKWST